MIQIGSYIFLDLARASWVFCVSVIYVIEADEPRFKVVMAILTIFGHFWTNFSAINSEFKDMGN